MTETVLLLMTETTETILVDLIHLIISQAKQHFIVGSCWIYTHSQAKQFQSLIIGFEISLTMSYYHTKLPIDNVELRRWDDYLVFIEDKDISKVNGVFRLDLITFKYFSNDFRLSTMKLRLFEASNTLDSSDPTPMTLFVS